MRALEKINFLTRLEEQMRKRKESNKLNSVNQQTPKMNKGEKRINCTRNHENK
jgi:hypothetical protein